MRESSKADIAKSAPGAPVAVLGASGLLFDLTCRTLVSEGLRVMHDEAWVFDHFSGGVLVLVDPEPRHWQAADRIRAPVVHVSESDLVDGFVVTLILRGADAVLGPATPLTALPSAVRAVHEGSAWLERRHVRAVIDHLRTPAGRYGSPVLSGSPSHEHSSAEP